MAATLLPHLLGYVMPVSFLLGAIVGVGRLAEDREVMAIGAAGLSPVRLVRVPLAIGVVVAAVGLWFSVSVEPAGLREARLRFNEIIKRNLTANVRPGTFFDEIPGYTVFAARVGADGWGDVLISDRSDPTAPVLALARRGKLEPVGSEEEMRLVLEQGEVHREDPGGEEYVRATFRVAGLTLGVGTALTDRNALSGSTKELTQAELATLAVPAEGRSAAQAARLRGGLPPAAGRAAGGAGLRAHGGAAGRHAAGRAGRGHRRQHRGGAGPVPAPAGRRGPGPARGAPGGAGAAALQPGADRGGAGALLAAGAARPRGGPVILPRYIGGKTWLASLAAFAGVITIFLAVDIVDNAGVFSGPGWVLAALELYANKAAVVAHQIAPAALLLGAAIAVSGLRQTREWTAMRSVGLGPWRVALPVVAAVGGVALALVLLHEAWGVKAAQRAEEIQVTRFARGGAYRRWQATQQPKRWFRGADGRHVYHLRGVLPGGGFERVTVLELSDDFRLVRRIDAGKMEPAEGGAWRLADVEERTFAPEGGSYHRAASREYRFDEPPGSFDLRPGRPSQMTLAVLAQQIAVRERLGQPSVDFAIERANRAGLPVRRRVRRAAGGGAGAAPQPARPPLLGDAGGGGDLAGALGGAGDLPRARPLRAAAGAAGGLAAQPGLPRRRGAGGAADGVSRAGRRRRGAGRPDRRGGRGAAAGRGDRLSHRDLLRPGRAGLRRRGGGAAGAGQGAARRQAAAAAGRRPGAAGARWPTSRRWRAGWRPPSGPVRSRWCCRPGPGSTPPSPAAPGRSGVRVTSGAVAAALAAAAGGALVATSANPSGQPPPTTAAGLDPALRARLDLVLDGGSTPGGAPSTVVAVEDGTAHAAAPRGGAIEALRAVAGGAPK